MSKEFIQEGDTVKVLIGGRSVYREAIVVSRPLENDTWRFKVEQFSITIGKDIDVIVETDERLTLELIKKSDAFYRCGNRNMAFDGMTCELEKGHEGSHVSGIVDEDDTKFEWIY